MENQRASFVRNERVSAALDAAISGGKANLLRLFDELSRNSGLPSPKPNWELAQAVGQHLAREGRKAEAVLDALQNSEDEFNKIVALATYAARILNAFDEARSMQAMQDIAEDGRHTVRAGTVLALRALIGERQDRAVADLKAWMDGYLQAHLVLEALSDRTLLSKIKGSAELLARLDEAFELADLSPRSAERSQGMRLLRGSLPAQIVVFAARFSEVLSWLGEKTQCKRPESREVVANAISLLRKASLSDADAAKLLGGLEQSAKPPRDPSRIVEGTRKRAKGRN